MRKQVLSVVVPDVAWAFYNLAFVLLVKGDHDEAKRFADEALSRRGPNLPDEHPRSYRVPTSYSVVSSLRGAIWNNRCRHLKCVSTFV